jgi:hypothetical protein
MQAVEEAHEFVAAGEVLRRRDLEACPVAATLVGGALAG